MNFPSADEFRELMRQETAKALEERIKCAALNAIKDLKTEFEVPCSQEEYPMLWEMGTSAKYEVIIVRHITVEGCTIQKALFKLS